MTQSIHRLKNKIARQEILSANEISLILVKLIEDTTDLQTFVNGFAWFYEHIV